MFEKCFSEEALGSCLSPSMQSECQFGMICAEEGVMILVVLGEASAEAAGGMMLHSRVAVEDSTNR